MKKAIFIFLFFLTIITLVIKAKTYIQENLSPQSQTDIVGHIKIKNTTIDYSLVQTTDNEYYLSHNIEKKEDKNGSIFIDYRNNLTDKKLLIYGHNSKYNSAPFKDLELYLNESYYRSNPYIELTIQNKTYKYQIFSVMTVEKTDYRHTQIEFKEKSLNEHLKWLKKSSLYDTKVIPTTKDYILVLQTCYYYPKNSYLLISAKRS